MNTEKCPVCDAGTVIRGGIVMFECGATKCGTIERLRTEKAELLVGLKMLVAASPAFRAMKIGADGSEERAKQDARIAAENAALAAIAKAEGRA